MCVCVRAYSPTGTTSGHCPLLGVVKVLEGRGRTGGPARRGSSPTYGGSGKEVDIFFFLKGGGSPPQTAVSCGIPPSHLSPRADLPGAVAALASQVLAVGQEARGPSALKREPGVDEGGGPAVVVHEERLNVCTPPETCQSGIGHRFNNVRKTKKQHGGCRFKKWMSPL